MPFPRTDTELDAAGYKFAGTSKCRGCNQSIAWYLTPKGKRIPLDEGTLESHWATCPKAKDFRK
jgi:hypothetical protein